MISGRIETTLITENGKQSSKFESLFSKYPFRYIESNKGFQSVASLCILGYGGGCISGDFGNFVWILNDNTTTCISTQGISKIFKTVNDKPCIQKVICEIGNNASLFFFPDPTSLFSLSTFEQSFTFLLESTSSLSFVDWFTCGRKQYNENWSFSRLKNLLNIIIDGETVFFENLDLYSSDSGSIAAKVGHGGLFGTLILIGPKTLSIRQRVDELYYNRDTFDQHVSGVMKRQKLNAKTTVVESNYSVNSSSSSDSTRSSSNSRKGCNSTPCGNCSTSVSVTHLHYGTSSTLSSSSSGNSGVMSVVRVIAPNAEEGYRLMSNILSPLVDVLGYVPYIDRIHSL